MKKLWLWIISVIVSFLLFVACDPVVPNENIRVDCSLQTVNVGDSVVVEISYPATDNTAVGEWVNQRVTVLKGQDTVSVSGLQVTALKKGTALLLVEVDANCVFGGIVIDQVTYSEEIQINVK